MGFDECYQLGNIIKSHGLKGELIIFLDVDEPENYQKMESVFVDINGKLVPFFIQAIQVRGERATCLFEDVDNIDSARSLVGKDIYLPLSQLPELPSGQYYYHQLVGMELIDDDRVIGNVTEVLEGPTQFLLSVDHQGTEVLVPVIDEIIQNVDLTNRVIQATLPIGLLDVYLSPRKP